MAELTKRVATIAGAKETFERYRRDLGFMRVLQEPAPATRFILIALGSVFVLGYALGALVVEPRFGGVENDLMPITYLAAKINAPIRQGEWWRLVTHAFLHGSVFHIIVNAYALHVLGGITERVFGTRRFLIIYAMSGLAGGIASFVFNDAASVGASGAIFGVFGAAVVFGFRYRSAVPPEVGRALSRGLLPWLGLSLVFGFLPQIDNAAHFGGLAAGAAIAATIGTPLTAPDRPAVARGLRFAVSAIVILVAAAWLLAMEHARGCLADADHWDRCQVSLETGE